MEYDMTRSHRSGLASLPTVLVVAAAMLMATPALAQSPAASMPVAPSVAPCPSPAASLPAPVASPAAPAGSATAPAPVLPSATPCAPASSPVTAAGSVTIKGFSFQPASLSVAVGSSVTWTNADSTAHTVTADDGSFDSSTLAPGATFSRTFATAGTFTYHCQIHPSMKATITVG
jgi:plastocyanin